MPRRALKDLDYGVGEVEEKVEPDEELNDQVRCSLKRGCEDVDVKEEN